MTISEFVSILDYKFILTLCPMDDKAKQILKDFLSEHKEEYGLESTQEYIDNHELSITFSVSDYTDELNNTFGKSHVLKTINDIYDRNTLIVYYK